MQPVVHGTFTSQCQWPETASLLSSWGLPSQMSALIVKVWLVKQVPCMQIPTRWTVASGCMQQVIDNKTTDKLSLCRAMFCLSGFLKGLHLA